MSTIDSVIRRMLQPLYGSSEAANLSKIICCEILGQNLTDYYLGKDMVLSSKQETDLSTVLQRLQHFEPIQYIQGYAPFLNRNFSVDRSVLIPRPETAELVQRVVAESRGEEESVLDIGTGSGCIAVSLALELPKASVSAWDVSEDALRVAQSNAERLGAPVNFKLRDMRTYQPAAGERYDTLVSNPPYVTKNEQKQMEPNVLNWEPALALFVENEDPLLFYRHLGRLGRLMLTEGGKLYAEINQYWGHETAQLFNRMGFQSVLLEKDMQGNDRFIIATK